MHKKSKINKTCNKSKRLPVTLPAIADVLTNGHVSPTAPVTTPTTPSPLKSAVIKSNPATTNHNGASPLSSVEIMTSRDFQYDINAHIEVAAQQLKDEVVMRQFQAAIMNNRHLFRGRIVLNINCGVGLLALFAAKAGAARVFAVDASNVVDYARQVVKDNGYDKIIEVLKGRIEDVELPVPQVDIIICNWMGYTLLFQATCDAVIYARDKWLKKPPHGLIFPDIAKLFVAAVEDSHRKNERVEWWNDVYGFKMSSLREFALSEPCFQTVQPKQIMSTQCSVKSLNLYTATSKDLTLRSKYMFEIRRSGNIDGVVTFFHVHFSKSHTPQGFSTDPCSAITHWMQTVFFFDQPMVARKGTIYYGAMEMFSPGDKCNLNNMEVGMEMFSGDPMELQLEMEMRWMLKPHACAVIHNANTAESPVKAQQLPQPPAQQYLPPIKRSSPQYKPLPGRGRSVHSIQIGSHVYVARARGKLYVAKKY